MKPSPAISAVPADVPQTTPGILEKVKLSIAPETVLVAGRGNILQLDIEPASAPAGAYIVLRGIPEDAVLSRGFAMGPETWLLSLTELKALEVRLPARVNGPIALDARLISADGHLLSADMRSIPTTNASGSLKLASLPSQQEAPQLPPAQAPAQPAARGAIIAPSPPPPLPSARPAPAAPQSTGSLPTPVPAPTPAPQKVISPETLVFTRGRRMLDAGNIAIARPLLERAAAAGSSEAATLLASSFDTQWLRRAGVIGIDGDADLLKRWQLEAQRLGQRAAAQEQKSR